MRASMLGLLLLALAACGAMEGADGASKAADYDTVAAADASGGYWEPGRADEGNTRAPDASYAEEPEETFAFESAALGETSVFIVDKHRDQVIVVDGQSLDVRSVKVGDSPVLVKALPGEDAVVVLNEGSQTATLVRLEGDQAQVTHFDVLPGVNRVEVSPYGPYAVLYYAFEEGSTSLGTLNAVNVLRAEAGKEAMVEVGIGFEPSGVAFREDGGAVAVVSRAGLTLVHLPEDVEEPRFRAPLPLVDDPLLNAEEREVLVTADGAYALTRVLGRPLVSVLDVGTGVAVGVPTAGDALPTDRGLVPGDERFVLTYRDARVIQVLSLAEVVATGALEGLTIPTAEVPLGLCTVAPDGSAALLYSLTEGSTTAALLDLAADPPALAFVPVPKTVRVAAIDPTSRYGVLYHTRDTSSPGTGDGFDDLVAKSHGFSILDLASRYVQPFLSAHEPKDLVFLPDFERMVVLLPDPSGPDHRVAVVDFSRFLATEHSLVAKPLSVQAFRGDGRAVVLEEHLSGRLTIVDAVANDTESVTGFHLNAGL